MDLNVPPAATSKAAYREAKAEEHQIAQDARNAGVPAFEFPPDASPQDKAAMAKRALPPGLDLSKAKATVQASLSGDAAAVVSDLLEAVFADSVVLYW
ncbi:hypothetical protein FN846DRAFT_129796 [Sphaerosporella brunnea]|uniref:Uncharacterized protein n=1 Tax=Sphaerosporella brunnea TaxID=1250544 RepID=A0A5J5F9J3_9PEZI|nr:hypothetical protein FN846DRAFT_129796 [Sphaerosporella brunnea]